MISALGSRMGQGLGQTGTAKSSRQKKCKEVNKTVEIQRISMVLSILDKKDALNSSCGIIVCEIYESFHEIHKKGHNNLPHPFIYPAESYRTI